MQKREYTIFLVTVCILLLFSPASAWLSGFDYKKEHAITYAGDSSLNSYQMRFVFWNTSGTDSGENCYLGSHINQTDWDDLRITTTNDGICDIWIQEKGANYAIVWAEVPYINPGNDNRVFVYYGKNVATAVSDGDATFRVWGTFEQTPLNVNKWGYTGNYTQRTDGSDTLVDIVYNATSGVSRIYSLDAFSYATGYELIGRVKLDLINESYFGFISGTKYALFRTDDEYTDSVYASTHDIGQPTYTNIGNTYSGWRILQVQRPPSGEYIRFRINGSQVANHTADIPDENLLIDGCAYALNANITLDWLFIKKYVDPEPQHGVWDAETVETAPNARFDANPQWGVVGSTVYFSDASTGVVDSWAWDINGDSVTDFTTKNCNYTYMSTGYYDVSLSVANTNGTSIETQEDYIYIYAAATATPTPTPTTSNMVALVDSSVAGITGVLVTVFVYALLLVGMFSGLLMLLRR